MTEERIEYKNGSVYVGKVKDGKMDGRGTYTFSNGSKYEGEFKDDKRNGRGTYIYPDGEKYEGEFKDDKSNGRGMEEEHTHILTDQSTKGSGRTTNFGMELIMVKMEPLQNTKTARKFSR